MVRMLNKDSMVSIQNLRPDVLSSTLV